MEIISAIWRKVQWKPTKIDSLDAECLRDQLIFFVRNEFGFGLRSSGELSSLYLLMFNDFLEQPTSPIFIGQVGFNYTESEAWNPTKFTWLLVQTGKKPISVRTPMNFKWWVQSCWTRDFSWMFIRANAEKKRVKEIITCPFAQSLFITGTRSYGY